MHDFIPIGPFHPALWEPEYFKLYVHGDEIVDVGIYLGFNHKGIEKLLESKNWYQAIFTSERICGICGIVHTSAYCQAVENLLELEVPLRANYIRSIMNECERIQSHLLWLGLTSHQIGLETLFMRCLSTRELMMDIVEIFSGSRVHYGINTIGGVRRDISKEQSKEISESMKKLKKECEGLREIFLSNPTINRRFTNIGVLKKNRAEELSAVGPVARASGVHMDVREIGYFAYPDSGFKMITRSTGDCMARLQVRLDELLESLHMIETLNDRIPIGEVKVPRRFMKIEFGESMGRVEAPRGEVIHFVISKGDIGPYRVRIRTPSYANNQCLRDMLVGCTITDAAVIIESLDPCFSCTDRALVVDEKTGKGKVTNLEELVPGHSHMDIHLSSHHQDRSSHEHH